MAVTSATAEPRSFPIVHPPDPTALDAHVAAHSLPLCNRSWLRGMRDTVRCALPPPTQIYGFARARINRARMPPTWSPDKSATFKHNGFIWGHPALFDDGALRQHYAFIASQKGVRAGVIEACALAESLGARLTLWQVSRSRAFVGKGEAQLLGDFGSRTPDAPRIAIGVIGETHFRALMPHAEKLSYHETEAGGLGDCLYHAARAALQPYGGAVASLRADALRALAAKRIAADARYDEHVRAATEQAWGEHAKRLAWNHSTQRR